MIFQFEQIEALLGYKFQNKNLLIQAFTHKSYSNEHKAENNERLEFLGDSILGYVVSEYLFREKRNHSEGEMTKRKQLLVSTKPLAFAVRKMGLERFILFGEGVVRPGDPIDRFTENLFEAIVAAIYLDGGLEKAKDFINRCLLSQKACINDEAGDYKSLIQIYSQGKKLGTPAYQLISKTGPDHSPMFTIAVTIGGKTIAVGSGKSKGEASKDAARRAYKKMTRQE